MQILLNGLLQGFLFGAVGVAFSLVYRTTGVFHVVLGGGIALAPYVVLTATGCGIAPWGAVLLALAVVALLCVLVEETVHWPLTRQRAPSEVHFIASLGFYLVTVQCIALAWGNESRVLRTGADVTWSFGNVILAQRQLVGSLLALGCTLVLLAWLKGANRGVELRALADNPLLVSLLGRNVPVIRRWVFALSGALAAAAALGQSWDVGFDPHSGLKSVLIGMVAMIIGGTGSYVGPLVGGVLLGVLRAEVAWFGSSRWEEAATFALLVVFLFLRPGGIFKRQVRLEAL